MISTGGGGHFSMFCQKVRNMLLAFECLKTSMRKPSLDID